eukprot:scaffold5284_cov110-Skeletonema_menzelii.AAC.3
MALYQSRNGMLGTSFLSRECIEYTERVFHLLKVYPETIMSIISLLPQQPATDTSQSKNGKERKFGPGV